MWNLNTDNATGITKPLPLGPNFVDCRGAHLFLYRKSRMENISVVLDHGCVQEFMEEKEKLMENKRRQESETTRFSQLFSFLFINPSTPILPIHP